MKREEQFVPAPPVGPPTIVLWRPHAEPADIGTIALIALEVDADPFLLGDLYEATDDGRPAARRRLPLAARARAAGGAEGNRVNTLHLEVNDSGAWRRVMSFERLDIVVENVMLDAGQLLSAADNERIRARIIAPGTTAPLMTWTRDRGWNDWPMRQA